VAFLVGMLPHNTFAPFTARFANTPTQ
jgi:hypothetical protein